MATVKVAGQHDGVDADAPTVEQLKPPLRSTDNPTIRQKIDAAARAGFTTTSDQTAELALDDLGLDLGSLNGELDKPAAEASADAPTMVATLGDETRQIVARAASQPKNRLDDDSDLHRLLESEQLGANDKTQLAPSAAFAHGEESAELQSSPSGTWLFTDAEVAEMSEPLPSHAPTQLMEKVDAGAAAAAAAAGAATASTSIMAKIDTSKLDIDFGDIGESGHGAAPAPHTQAQTGDAHATAAASDGHANGHAAATSRTGATYMEGADIVALPDLEPATMSEVGTKLDLARAYIDMGDPEGARSILSEVLGEGSVSQKQEARRLMDSLPGA